jgi:enterochelin esterase-like enzyme
VKVIDPLAQVEKTGTPLVDGTHVTFLWQGPEPACVMGDFNFWDENRAAKMQPAGEQLWILEMDLPEDAYVEYILQVGSERVYDPLNQRKIDNGLGMYNNYFSMPGRRPAREIRLRKGARSGRLARVRVWADDFLASPERDVTFYSPPVDEAVALVVVYDGGDYLRFAKMARIVDNLIASRQIQPVGLAFVENGGDARTLEYACAESTLRFILSRVIPLAGEQMHLLDIHQNPGAYGVVGASMGGLMALYSGLRLPHIFGRVLAQSGGYTLDGYEYIVWDLARQVDPEKLSVWMDVGKMELLLNCNREMYHLLQKRGFPVAYHEYAGGHNYSAWRDDLPAGLRYLFGSV